MKAQYKELVQDGIETEQMIAELDDKHQAEQDDSINQYDEIKSNREKEEEWYTKSKS